MYQTALTGVTGAVTIECPCCAHDLDVTVYPPESATRLYPGSPGEIDSLGPCECREYAEARGFLERYDEDVHVRVLRELER